MTAIHPDALIKETSLNEVNGSSSVVVNSTFAHGATDGYTTAHVTATATAASYVDLRGNVIAQGDGNNGDWGTGLDSDSDLDVDI